MGEYLWLLREKPLNSHFRGSVISVQSRLNEESEKPPSSFFAVYGSLFLSSLDAPMGLIAWLGISSLCYFLFAISFYDSIEYDEQTDPPF